MANEIKLAGSAKPTDHKGEAQKPFIESRMEFMGRSQKVSDTKKWGDLKKDLEEPLVLTLIESGDKGAILSEFKPVLNMLEAKKNETSKQISALSTKHSKIEAGVEAKKQECLKRGVLGAEAFLNTGHALKVIPKTQKAKIKKTWRLSGGIPFDKLDDLNKAKFFAACQLDDLRKQQVKTKKMLQLYEQKLLKINETIVLINQLGSGGDFCLRIKIFYEIQQHHYPVLLNPMFITRIEKLESLVNSYIKKNGFMPIMDQRAKQALKKTGSAAHPKDRAIDKEDAKQKYIIKFIDSVQTIDQFDKLCNRAGIAKCLKNYRIDDGRKAANFDPVNRSDPEKSIFSGSDSVDDEPAHKDLG